MERKNTLQQRRDSHEAICWALVGSQVWTTRWTWVTTFCSRQRSEIGFIILALQRRKLRWKGSADRPRLLS